MEQNYWPLIGGMITIAGFLIAIVTAIAKAYHRIEDVVKENAELKKEVDTLKVDIKKEVADLTKDQANLNTDVKVLSSNHGYVLTTLGEIKGEVTRIFEMLRVGH